MIESEVLEVRVGDVHVTPEQVADANIGTFGPDDYVLSTGRKLEAQVVTNNSVRVFDGVMVYGGIRDVISVNKYYDIQIDNGAQGMNRNDIIVRHFAITDEVTKRGGATFQVIKGTPSEGEAADPEIAFTDLRAGALSHDMILHRVRIEGLNIVAVEPLYDILYNAAELKEEVTELNRKLDQESSTKVMGFSFLRRGNEVLMTHNSILEVVEAGHVYTNQGSIPMGYRPVLDLSAIPGLITDGNNKIRGTWWLVANSTGSINVISSITHSDPLSYVTSASWPTSDVINL